jgi:hypothetical protein
MPAVSRKQQEFMAIAEHEPEKLKGKMPDMSHQQLHDFASTSHEGLPEAKKVKRRTK